MPVTENSRPETLQRYENIIRDNLENIQQWRAAGYESKQIAEKLGMTRACMYVFLRKMKDFRAAWDFGDTALLQGFIVPTIKDRAENGFKFTEVTKEIKRNKHGDPVLDEEGKEQFVVTKIVEKVAPCNQFLRYMAEKLDPEKWGSKKKDDSEELEIAEDMKEYFVSHE